jgi:zinc and cadmium transporter
MFLFSALSSVGGVATAAFVLLVPDRHRRAAVTSLVSYATGAMLATALLGVIPEALELAPAGVVMSAVLGGMGLFFVVEKLVLGHHCHDDRCDRHRAAARLILLGDGLHNFVDGILIAAAFLTSVPLGVATALATLLHELPQEIGDFAVLLESGYSRQKALWMNLLSSLATIAGTAVAYLWLDSARQMIPLVLGLAAGSFIYIASVDLIPLLHRRTQLVATAQQVLLAVAGAGTIALLGAHGH